MRLLRIAMTGQAQLTGELAGVALAGGSINDMTDQSLRRLRKEAASVAARPRPQVQALVQQLAYLGASLAHRLPPEELEELLQQIARGEVA